jgi:glucose/mannose-6-phosphate isomerase
VGSLDDPDLLARDSLGLVRGTGGAVEAFDAAREAANAVEFPFPSEVVKNVLICGMGGSAIAGELIAGAYRERLRVPVAVHRDYEIPGWVGPDTLVILSSYSGNTEETLTATMQAYERNCPCVAITSGGKLGSFYAKEGIPVVPLPGGMQPRAALLWLMVPVAVILERTEVLPPLGSELEEARETIASVIAACGPDVPQEANPAKQLAAALHGKVALIWGAEVTAAVARRWKGQLNENAKVPAYWSELPELDHNEIVGFAGMGPLTPMTQLVMLRDPRNHRQIVRRFELTGDLIKREVSGVLSITAEGRGAMARMLDLVLLGDYVSLYLALMRDIDPGPVEVIEALKDRLANTGFGRSASPDEPA